MNASRAAAAAVILTLVLAAAGPGRAQSGQAEKPLTLRETLVHALKHNLGIAAEVLTPEMADFAVRQAGEIFIPQLSFEYARQETNSASFSWIDSSGQISTAYNNFSATVSQLIPTGGRLDVSLTNYKTDTSQSFLTINPRYGSTLTFDFRQPLLRGFGTLATRQAILVARNDREQSEHQFRAALTQTIYDVEEAYWNLVFAVQNLTVRQDSLRLARELLSKNERELEAGIIAPLELLNAKAEVAGREADILQAESEVRTSEDILRTLMNLPAGEGGAPARIVPADQPGLDAEIPSLDEAIRLALDNRPDLGVARAALQTKAVNMGVARNALLPQLDLTASYWSPGVSGTQILYQDNNPLTGIIVGKVPGGASMAFKDASNFRYKNWWVGLRLDVPLNTVFSRAEFARARLDAEQAELRLRDDEQQAVLDVTTAHRAVETDRKRVLAYQASRELEEEKFRAEEKKLAAGLSTNYTVLQVQRDLATARSNELRAIIDLNLSLAALDRAMGVTLRNKGIDVTEAGR